MTIRTKLSISTFIEVMLIISVGVLLIGTTNNIKHASENESQATRVTETITRIRFLTFDHLFRHNDRSYEQWKLEQTRLSLLLEPQPYQSQTERNVIKSIANNNRESRIIFQRLAADYTVFGAKRMTVASADFQEQQASRLLLKQQAQISDAFKYTALAANKTTALRERLNRLAVALIVLMFIIMCVNFLYVVGTIGNAIKEFQKGADKISDGQFNYRIRTKSHTDELKRLSVSFNFMAAALEQIDKVRSEFILIASHQLRTPLTAIKWSSEALIEPRHEITDDKRERYIQNIHNSNERMIKLVDALLNVAKIDSESLTSISSPVQLPGVLEEVLADLSVPMHKKHISVVKDLDKDLPTVFIDPTWLRVIIQNLVSNAVKYSKDGQVVTVSISNQVGSVVISVKDNGYGIPASQQDKIFKKLFRADNAFKHEAEGSGLGLYITKALVEAAGGTIWFESSENEGSIFYVKLSTEV